MWSLLIMIIIHMDMSLLKHTTCNNGQSSWTIGIKIFKIKIKETITIFFPPKKNWFYSVVKLFNWSPTKSLCLSQSFTIFLLYLKLSPRLCTCPNLSQMETRVLELLRLDEHISCLMACLRQANKVKWDQYREINNDIAITITCHLDLETAIFLKKSKGDWNPK